MSIEKTPEFHYLGEEDNNSNAYRNRARIPLFGSIISEKQCFKSKARILNFIKIRQQLQCLEGQHQNSDNV